MFIKEEDVQHLEEWLEYTHPGMPHMPMKDYLDFWYDGKKEFLFELFDNELIKEKEIEFNLSNSKILDYLFNLTDYKKYKIKIEKDFENILTFLTLEKYPDLNNISFRQYLSYNVLAYLDIDMNDQEKIDNLREVSNLSQMIDRVLKDSTLVENNIKWASPNESYKPFFLDKPVYIRNGQKPLKVLYKLCKTIQKQDESGSDIYDKLLNNIKELQNIISIALTQQKTKGTLKLSIHPLDYATMSDNGYGWHSCMRWSDGRGEYHAGTLEMMTSPCVVVAYLEGDSTWYPTRGEWTWSNKKWRELFIVQPDKYIVGIKGYPYQSDSLEKESFNMLCDMLNAKGSHFNKNGNFEITDDGSVEAPNGVVIDFETDMMYNDVRYNKCRVLFDSLAYKDKIDNYHVEYCYYGVETYCISCGEPRVDHNDSACGYLCCSNCDNVLFCANCGEPIYGDDYYVLQDGSIICYDCTTEMASCSIDGELMWESEANYFSVYYYSQIYDSKEGKWIIDPLQSKISEQVLSMCSYHFDEFLVNGWIKKIKFDDNSVRYVLVERPTNEYYVRGIEDCMYYRSAIYYPDEEFIEEVA